VLEVAIMIEGQDGLDWPRWRRLASPGWWRGCGGDRVALCGVAARVADALPSPPTSGKPCSMGRRCA
jgi:hypothetical protein